MADNIALIKLEVQVADGEVKVDRLKSKLQQLTKGSDDYNLVVKKIQIAENNLAKTRDRLTKSTQGLIGDNKKGLSGLEQAAGASTSATLELGRVLSDMPYGIRGVANNLQQLASNLFFMSKATDKATGKSVGFAGALKNLLGGLIGPAGILIAFQGIIALFDYLSSGAKKAGDSVSDLKSEFKELSEIIQVNTNMPIEDYLELVKKKNELTEKETKSIERLKEIEKELNDVRYNLKTTNDFDNLTKLRQEEKDLQEEIKKIYKDSAVAINDYNSAKDKLTAADEDSLKGLKNQLKIKEQERELLSKTSEDYKRLTITIDDYKKKIEEIEGKKTKGTAKDKFSPFKSKRELDLDVKNQEDALLQFEKKIRLQTLRNSELEELSSAKTEEEKTKIKRKYAAQRLEIELSIEEKKLILAKSNERQIAKIKHDEHVAQLKRVLEEYKLKVKLNKPKQASQLISDAESKTKTSIAQAGAELIKTNKEIDDAYKPLFETFKKLAKLRRDALGILPDDKKSEEFDALSSYLESFKIAMSGITEFVNGEYDRQLTIEQNKTNALNEQLNNRLLNEQLSADQRKNIQNQIYQNDEILRKKQDEIAKKRFNTQKAFNIAMATADSYLAGVKVLADPFFVGRPFARGVAMAATIASGLASVAAIARQKFQSSSAATPVRTTGAGGAGGAGVGDRSFNFNLVGNTLGNQITDAIQGQFDQPLKAYVVSRDITSQQALDANIKGTASF